MKRLLIKTLSWRIIASSTTLGLVYALTGDLPVATTIGILDAVVKIGLYYCHELAWRTSK